MSTYYEQSIAAIDKLIATTAERVKSTNAKYAEAKADATAAIAIVEDATTAAINGACTNADAYAAAKTAEIAKAKAHDYASYAASATSAAKIAANHHGFLQKYHDDYDYHLEKNEEWSFQWNRYEFYFEALNAYIAFLREKGFKVEREEPMQYVVFINVTKQ